VKLGNQSERNTIISSPMQRSMRKQEFSRREFLKLSLVGLGGLALNGRDLKFLSMPEFPQAERLGRLCVGMVELKARPDENSQSVGRIFEDAVVPWLREVVGQKEYYINKRWVETPDGYVYAPYLQPVKYLPNQPVNELIETSIGPGMWTEVTVPYVDIVLESGGSTAWFKSRLEGGLPPRLYYGQVFWVDQIRTDGNGQTYYRVNPNYYGGLDMLWAPAEAFRPIQEDELAPINPGVEDKRIVVDVVHQTLSCFEGDKEVFFTRISSGAKFDINGNPVDKWSTPVGMHKVTRKYISLQMSGGTTGAGWDLPGIGWTSIFVTGGVAIHSTFWHNDYGVPRSHGCVNASPEDAKWIFMWAEPFVNYDPGAEDVAISGKNSTQVEVVEG